MRSNICEIAEVSLVDDQVDVTWSECCWSADRTKERALERVQLWVW